MNIYCDGSGYNGRTSGYCVIRGDYIERKIYEKRYTNNEMEWEAMIQALKIAESGDTVYSDSQLVVNQITGNWKIKESHLIPYADEGKTLLRSKRGVSVKWIPREQNDAGIYIERHF